MAIKCHTASKIYAIFQPFVFCMRYSIGSMLIGTNEMVIVKQKLSLHWLSYKKMQPNKDDVILCCSASQN